MRCRRLKPALWASLGAALVLVGPAAMARPGNGNGNGNGSSGGSSVTPYLSFAADRTEAALGDTVRLSWASTNARACFASGDWSGKFDTAGAYVTSPLDGPKTYTLECRDGGVGVRATVAVTIAAPAAPAPDPAPTVTLSAVNGVVASGGSTQLSWSSQYADSCTASGGWSGGVGTSGTMSVGPLDQDTVFNLSCTGPGGTAGDSVAVSIAPQPSVQLTAADAAVTSGGSTQLAWSSSNATDCSATGGWSGTKATTGSETVGPIDASSSYGLTCTGAGGSAMAMISVAVNGSVSLSWQAPTQNVDGTALTDLAGFRIYYGQISGSYTDHVDVTSPTSTAQSLTLPSGTYYFAMTAVDGSGNESAYSNEVTKTLN